MSKIPEVPNYQKFTLEPDFCPAPFCGNPHAQTFWAPLFRRKSAMPWRRFVIHTPDNDELDIRISPGKKNAPVLLFIHGLEGSYRSPLFSGMGRKMLAKGWRVAALSLRGSDRQNPGQKLYTAGDSKDLNTAIAWLNQKLPQAKVHVLGISLGANVVGKWLGEQGCDAIGKVSSALMLSPPVDLYTCSEATRTALFRIYDLAFLKDLKRRAIRKMNQLACQGMKPPIYVSAIKSAKTMMGFDDVFTAPMNGYHGMRDYYDRNSSGPLLKNVSVPLLILTSKDDPLIPISCFPLKEIRRNPSIRFLATNRGGHVGWVAWKNGRPFYWVEDQVVRWCEALRSA